MHARFDMSSLWRRIKSGPGLIMNFQFDVILRDFTPILGILKNLL